MEKDEMRNNVKDMTGGGKMAKVKYDNYENDAVGKTAFLSLLDNYVKKAQSEGKTLETLKLDWLGNDMRFANMQKNVGEPGKGGSYRDDVLVCCFFFELSAAEAENFMASAAQFYRPDLVRRDRVLSEWLENRVYEQYPPKDRPRKLNEMLKEQNLAPLFLREGKDKSATKEVNVAKSIQAAGTATLANIGASLIGAATFMRNSSMSYINLDSGSDTREIYADWVDMEDLRNIVQRDCVRMHISDPDMINTMFTDKMLRRFYD